MARFNLIHGSNLLDCPSTIWLGRVTALKYFSVVDSHRRSMYTTMFVKIRANQFFSERRQFLVFDGCDLGDERFSQAPGTQVKDLAHGNIITYLILNETISGELTTIPSQFLIIWEKKTGRISVLHTFCITSRCITWGGMICFYIRVVL